ncbi:uncharacterized protein Fot_22474 [Forsythia ovata]|uniref:Uncharacterized protein n=1 Tax=Forsythia ovata TaxID=205694 RepID=A0ABD1UXT8_9LAMI
MNNVSDSSLELDHMISYEGKSKSGRSKFDEKCATLDEAKKNIILKKVADGGISRESSKGKSQLKLGGLDGSDSRLDVMKNLDKKNHLQPEHGDKRLSKKLYSGKGDRAEVNGSGKSHSVAKRTKSVIRRSGAITSLVNLLESGNFQGKKNACTALYSLCSVKENKIRSVQAGIMKPLVELMADFRSNMVDKLGVCAGPIDVNAGS